MAIITYPLNNTEYSAEDAELFHSTRSSGVFAAEEDFNASVSGADNTVTISAGIAWIRNSRFSGKVVANKEMVSLDMGVADGAYSRIDAIVLRFDANANNTTLVKKQGTASSRPVAPEVIQTAAVYELHLYHVLRRAGATSILDSDITDLRPDPQYCGIMSDTSTRMPQKLSQLVNDIIMPVGQGGTGATTAEEARSNIGAAPDGFGLGVASQNSKVLKTVEELEAISANGWYYFTGSFKVSEFTFRNVCVQADVTNADNIKLTVTGSNVAAIKGTTLVRYKTDGTWGEWSWENPPMNVAGRAFRTTEMHRGKPVYTVYIDHINEPGYTANGYTQTSVDISSLNLGIKSIIRYSARLYDHYFTARILPYLGNNGYVQVEFDLPSETRDVTTIKLVAYNNPVDVGFGGDIQIWYTKE